MNETARNAALEAVDSTAKKPRRYTHSALYSWVNSKRMPKGKAFQKVRRELSAMRDQMVERHGGKDITPEAVILIDSVIEGLGVQKLLGLYVRQYGVIDGPAAKAGRLELTPILSKNWVSYANVVRQGILALKELEKGRQSAPQAEIEAILTSYSRQGEKGDDDEKKAV